MTEQTAQPEVLGGAEEPEGRPTPEVSEVSAAVTPSSQQVGTGALEAKLDTILTKFEDQAQRRAQSVFDKTGYQFETMAKYLAAAGGDPKKAAREMAIDQVVQREMSSQSSEPEVPGRTKGEDSEKRTAQFLNDLQDESGIEMSDEELKEIWGGKRYTNYDDAFKDARKAAFKKAKQENIGAGAAASSGGARSSVPETDDEIVAGIEKAMKTPTNSAAELKRLQEEAKKRGLLK
jgi:hypothetical protein